MGILKINWRLTNHFSRTKMELMLLDPSIIDIKDQESSQAENVRQEADSSAEKSKREIRIA